MVDLSSRVLELKIEIKFNLGLIKLNWLRIIEIDIVSFDLVYRLQFLEIVLFRALFRARLLFMSLFRARESQLNFIEFFMTCIESS